MFKLKIFPLLILVIGFSIGGIAQKNALKGLDAYIDQTRIDYNVPGMSVAIVKDGKTIYEKGFGVKDVKTGEKVDANTLFAIASNSKAYTATLMAMLVEEGKVSWDDNVRDYLPWFELYDNYVSSEMTIRDLLCHRSGLATFSGDLIWYGSKYSAEEVVRRAKHLEQAIRTSCSSQLAWSSKKLLESLGPRTARAEF
jgi:CubicO group peptidase (beta-lactamase class C family)